MKLGCSLQRLFSTFPDGWPGHGLLLLRLGAGISLICFGIAALSGALGDPVAVARESVAAAGGIVLLAGLWTPLSGALVAMDELWIASSRHFSQQGDLPIHILLAVMSAGVAMLGPGAWSVDAYLFGRKRFDIVVAKTAAVARTPKGGQSPNLPVG
jgi:putative oxidoreductase